MQGWKMREKAYAGARRLIWEVYTALIRNGDSFCLFYVWGVHSRRDARWDEVDNEWQIGVVWWSDKNNLWVSFFIYANECMNA